MTSGKTTFDEPADDPAGRFERPVFAAMIRPHRSLGPQGFRIVMALVCLTSIIASLPFVILGVWPVVGFFGLDFLGLYLAFRVNFRDGTSFEELILTRIDLLVRHVTPKGLSREWRFNPLWTRIERKEDIDFGLLQLSLVSRDRDLTIAEALSPPEREDFAKALTHALRDVKRGH